jgi:hypothetical protein
VRPTITAVVVDYGRVSALRKEGLSWSMIFEQLAGGSQVRLTQAQADALYKNGFARWAARRRMLITARFEAFPKLRDLSAVVDPYVVENRNKDWVGPFLRSQFVKPERRM